jgi:hypothetical protein
MIITHLNGVFNGEVRGHNATVHHVHYLPSRTAPSLVLELRPWTPLPTPPPTALVAAGVPDRAVVVHVLAGQPQSDLFR